MLSYLCFHNTPLHAAEMFAEMIWTKTEIVVGLAVENVLQIVLRNTEKMIVLQIFDIYRYLSKLSRTICKTYKPSFKNSLQQGLISN